MNLAMPTNLSGSSSGHSSGSSSGHSFGSHSSTRYGDISVNLSGRTISKISDLSKQERLLLYLHTRILKEAILAKDTKTLQSYKINHENLGDTKHNKTDTAGPSTVGLYEVFLEDSTRTRESFKNAAQFHNIKCNELNAESSSFNKFESYTDTITNLIGYYNTVFVIRSSLEGVCTHLDKSTRDYLKRNKLPFDISFINAGDGRHEHPTQEFLDEFTFFEDLNWSNKKIHLALVGDLYYGRTVHSKIEGLNFFDEVVLDLVAPPELALPAHYMERAQELTYTVRVYNSIDEYCKKATQSTQGIAHHWYFTRPQLERMGERILQRQSELRKTITITVDHMPYLKPNTVFYHPLPRHREFPTISYDFDNTPFNGWERQSQNGYYLRIVLLALIAGKLNGHTPQVAQPQKKQALHTPLSYRVFVSQDEDSPSDSIPVDTHPQRDAPDMPDIIVKENKRYAEGIRPIKKGLVIDHIRVGTSIPHIRQTILRLSRVIDFNGRGGEWIAHSKDGLFKGLLFRIGTFALTTADYKLFSALVPGATVNLIEHSLVKEKARLLWPPQIADIKWLICHNQRCISHPSHREHISACFNKDNNNKYVCEYCSTRYNFDELWNE